MIRHCLRTYLFFCSFFFFNYPTFSQTHDVQAGLIFGCTKYIEWPSQRNVDQFVIAVTGDGKMLSAIETLAASKKVKGKKVIVKWHDNLNFVPDCDILYIGSDATHELDKVLEMSYQYNILLVSGYKGLAHRGIGLNIIMKDSRPAIELNKKQIEKANLKVSSQLIGLAIAVD